MFITISDTASSDLSDCALPRKAMRCSLGVEETEAEGGMGGVGRRRRERVHV